jgi:hypothetical protein
MENKTQPPSPILSARMTLILCNVFCFASSKTQRRDHFFVKRQAYTFHGLWVSTHRELFLPICSLLPIFYSFPPSNDVVYGKDETDSDSFCLRVRTAIHVCMLSGPPQVPVWTLWWRKKSRLWRESNLGRRARSLVALKRLSYPGSIYYFHGSIKYCFLVGMGPDWRSQWPLGLRLEPSSPALRWDRGLQSQSRHGCV